MRVAGSAEGAISRSLAGSARKSIAALTNASRSMGVDRPVTFSMISSLVPLVRVRRQGTPQLIASAQTSEKPSRMEGNSSASAA